MFQFLLSPTFIWGLTLAIFLLDVLTSSGIAIAVLYGLVVLLAATRWSKQSIVAFSILCNLLTATAYGLGQGFDVFGEAFARFVVSLAAILVITFLAFKRKTSSQGLIEREEALRRAEQRKEKFISMLAHEVRGSIAPINGAAHLLRMSLPENEEVDEATDIIIRRSSHLSALVDDMLDQSSVSKGISPLEKNKVNMNQVASEAVARLRLMIDKNKHQVNLQLSEQPAEIRGDFKRLVRAVSSLLSNAVETNPDGGTIKLLVSRTLHQVELTIGGVSVGNFPVSLRRDIEESTQAGQIPQEDQGSLGMDFEVVKDLVEAHGGSVETVNADSVTLGAVTIKLPAIASEYAESSFPTAVPALTSMHPLSILVVDDNADVAKMLAKFLIAAGHEAMAVNDAKEALATAAEHSFDAYLLDIGLPEIDGNALARRLRQLPNSQNALLVAITGYGQKFDRNDSLQSGFDNYFVKPVNPIELIALLKKWKSREDVSETIYDANDTNVQ